MEIVARWLLMKPVLQNLIRRADEELVHEGSNIIIICGALIIGIVLFSRG